MHSPSRDGTWVDLQRPGRGCPGLFVSHPVAPVPGWTEGSCHRNVTALSTSEQVGVLGGGPVDGVAGQNGALFELRRRALPAILLQPALAASPDDARPYDGLGLMIGEAALQYLE